jgi:hypothetical protein
MSDHDMDPAAVDERPAWRRNLPLVVGVVVLAGAGAAAWLWLVGTQADGPPAAGASAATSPPRVLPPSPPEPAVANPIDPGAGASGPPTTEELESTLAALVGNDRLQSLFRLQDLPRRVVTTIDNLGRAQASASLWPVNPPAGPFTTDRGGEAEVIAATNAARYAPYVELLESVDLERATGAYRRLYPLFQQAYENLGYPDRYFNDRVVEVIDVLLVTPEPRGPLRVRLPEFSEDVKPERPWVLYRFEDPALQELAAGQRMLLRMGAENRRRVKQVLTALRLEIATTPPPRTPPAAAPVEDAGEGTAAAPAVEDAGTAAPGAAGR